MEDREIQSMKKLNSLVGNILNQCEKEGLRVWEVKKLPKLLEREIAVIVDCCKWNSWGQAEDYHEQAINEKGFTQT